MHYFLRDIWVKMISLVGSIFTVLIKIERENIFFARHPSCFDIGVTIIADYCDNIAQRMMKCIFLVSKRLKLSIIFHSFNAASKYVAR